MRRRWWWPVRIRRRYYFCFFAANGSWQTCTYETNARIRTLEQVQEVQDRLIIAQNQLVMATNWQHLNSRLVWVGLRAPEEVPNT